MDEFNRSKNLDDTAPPTPFFDLRSSLEVTWMFSESYSSSFPLISYIYLISSFLLSFCLLSICLFLPCSMFILVNLRKSGESLPSPVYCLLYFCIFVFLSSFYFYSVTTFSVFFNCKICFRTYGIRPNTKFKDPNCRLWGGERRGSTRPWWTWSTKRAIFSLTSILQ